MDWRIKACIQGVLSNVPGGARLNSRLQALVGERADEPRHVQSKFEDDWLFMMELLQQQGFAVRGKVLMEIGTGWLPVLPLCFALAGARRVYCFDLHRHLQPRSVAAVLQHLIPHLAALAEASGQALSEVISRHEFLSAASNSSERKTLSVLQSAGIDYQAPADAGRTGLNAGSMDLIFSNSVLEHVSEPQLAALMRESARLLGPQGLSLHGVNCADHFSFFDRSIPPNHYLRFSSRQWRRWNNALLFQNRLRPSDFIAAAEAAGLHIAQRVQTTRLDLLKRLPRDRIAPEFHRYSDADLCTTSITFAAERAGTAST